MVTYFKKILVIILLTVLFLEAGLRVEGFVSSYLRERRNRINLSQKGTYRILCLGESMTAGRYPPFLEKKLNQRNICIRFSVIDRAVPGADTAYVLANLESNLDTYYPDMVIAMIGLGDQGIPIPYKTVSSSSLVRFLKDFRVYKLAVIIKLQIATKLREFNLEKLNLQVYRLFSSLQRRSVAARTGDMKKIIILESGGKNVLSDPFFNSIFQDSLNPEKLAKTENELKQAAAFSPKDDRAYFELGVYYIARKILPQAESALAKSISLNPNNADSYSLLLLCYCFQSKFWQADEVLKKALEANPREDWAYVLLGFYYRYCGNIVQAESTIKKAIRINPKNYEAYAVLGGCYRDSGKVDMAVEAFRKAQELNPRDGRLHFLLGRIYQEQGNFSLAEAAFKKVVELFPANPLVYTQLGVFYREQSRYVQSEEAFEKALSHGPGDENLHIELGNLYKIQQKFAQAEEEYTKAQKLNLKNISAYSALGELHHDQGDLFREEEVYKKFIELNPDSDQGYAQLGLFYRVQGKFSQADDLFKKTLELNPKNGRVLAARSALYEEIGKERDAEDSKSKANRLLMENYLPYAANNFRKMKEILDRREVRLVCMQYPMRNVELLKRMFQGDDKNVIFVDNEKIFRDAVRESGFSDYFVDAMGGNYGHCTEKGSRLMADNIAGVVSREVFHKQ